MFNREALVLANSAIQVPLLIANEIAFTTERLYQDIGSFYGLI